MDTNTVQSTRDFLKSITTKCHAEIEAQIGLTKKVASIQDYTHLLKKYFSFYSGLEPKIEKYLEKFPNDLNWADRKKIGLLSKDLNYFGFNIEDLNLGNPKLPKIGSLAGAYGVIYVLEGSTLGGQLLKKHFEHTLNILPETGGAFFNAYGPMTGKMWQSFINVLEREVRSDVQRTHAADAAQITFSALGHWVTT